ncbi:hypothetical protein [Rugamonas apoptosis]|uniref:Uncharacterized protein n=1 Tax=Rugamonas apoptosis TaxID=2758570 RepID=A0A7W2FCJ9_9BURK|nr:hypothetical protein [Rugamonas apoptosis]MBA5689227.1 hypothetical protein [Rugamonas apoptosis]
MTTFLTRKPIASLTRADLEAFPIWEFATDEEGHPGRDETWVRPSKASLIPLDSYSLSIRAQFLTPTGNLLHGFISVNTVGEFETVHGAIFTNSDYVFIPWPGYGGAKQSAAEAAAQLSLAIQDLFPLHFRLALPLEGESTPRNGIYAFQ